jgi:hypothetical protein
MKMISKKLGVRLAALTAATVGLSGCVYDAGLGYASDGYGYNDYNCDPYSAFDSYYDCDNSYGFYNIGFGGGWYDSYWYPGHGYYVFDNYGRRFNMRDNHRRYWGDRRQRWYRDNRGHDGGRGDGRGYGRGRDNGDRSSGAVGSGGWDGRNNNRDDRRGGRDNGQNSEAVSQPVPQPMARPGPDRRGERAGRGDGQGRGRYQQPAGAAPQNAAPQQQQQQPPAARQQQPARQQAERQTARPRGDGPRKRQDPNRIED